MLWIHYFGKEIAYERNQPLSQFRLQLHFTLCCCFNYSWKYGIRQFFPYRCGRIEPVVNPGESTKVSPGRKSSPAECQTCKERKYQDGSDEMVSFKSAAHISPEASASTVRAHEQEHVSNAYRKAAKGDGKVISANVSLQRAICPECGRSYVSGGTTSTKISYPNEQTNPYARNQKSADAAMLIGSNLDLAV